MESVLFDLDERVICATEILKSPLAKQPSGIPCRAATRMRPEADSQRARHGSRSGDARCGKRKCSSERSCIPLPTLLAAWRTPNAKAMGVCGEENHSTIGIRRTPIHPRGSLRYGALSRARHGEPGTSGNIPSALSSVQQAIAGQNPSRDRSRARMETFAWSISLG